MTDKQTQSYVQLHLGIPHTPMNFISVDLIGPLEVTAKSNQYALTVICMLTNYATCVPLTDKSANTVVSTNVREVGKSYLTIKVSLKTHYFWRNH